MSIPQKNTCVTQQIKVIAVCTKVKIYVVLFAKNFMTRYPLIDFAYGLEYSICVKKPVSGRCPHTLG